MALSWMFFNGLARNSRVTRLDGKLPCEMVVILLFESILFSFLNIVQGNEKEEGILINSKQIFMH
jgi:hypothetical protein